MNPSSVSGNSSFELHSQSTCAETNLLRAEVYARALHANQDCKKNSL